jgi:molybdenum cofactor guanylyltransferase
MLTGVVLAGGESRRFGRNKALEPWGGKPLINRCIESLRTLCDPILVIANDLRCYYSVPATLVRDLTPHQGPLGGIYTALLFSPHPWILVKATDMPFLVPELPVLLLQAREGADVVVPVVDAGYEPLLALYHRRCLPAIAATLASPRRKVSEIYQKVKVRTLDQAQWRIVDPEGRSFWNINTPADRERLMQSETLAPAGLS